ncbi:hypothetical protein [Martelella mediterranea]|uniref:Uncharacterized protein n=1 Tax=Martelella mediterranea TaxID=293089 RepID=A0A4R3NKE7_9HYPH|nr:hypothetical protein [Martelella mediterranea]TCT34647.1 hypothetical protein EDC90_103341 [Martelella mediterranea]
MAFNIKGFRTVDYIPHPSGEAGANLGKHVYATNDDPAAIETAGYFNDLATYKWVKTGDQIDCTLDLDGTPMRRNYIVTSVTSGVVAIAAQNVA